MWAMQRDIYSKTYNLQQVRFSDINSTVQSVAEARITAYRSRSGS